MEGYPATAPLLDLRSMLNSCSGFNFQVGTPEVSDHAYHSEMLVEGKQLGDASKSRLVRASCYVSSKNDGSEPLNFTTFYDAVLDAKGMSLGTVSSAAGSW